MKNLTSLKAQRVLSNMLESHNIYQMIIMTGTFSHNAQSSDNAEDDVEDKV